MYACEKSLAPHELFYLGLFNFVHSFFFHLIVILKLALKMLEFYFLFLNLKLWMNPSSKNIFWISTIMHQTWTSVEICQIVIVFCLHCICRLHLPCPIVWACNNDLRLLTNCMPLKSFVCGGVGACKNRCMSIDHSSALQKLI
jgi:hypothetical protein